MSEVNEMYKQSCFNCDDPLPCQCDHPEAFTDGSDGGPACPHCGEIESDPQGTMDEGSSEWKCSSCSFVGFSELKTQDLSPEFKTLAILFALNLANGSTIDHRMKLVDLLKENFHD